jgi:hypothetical protein
MRSLQWMSAGFALLFGAGYAHAQAQGAGAGTATASATIGLTSPTGPGFRNVIKGAPFSADVIEESDQALADGNHIHREKHGRIFRDSEGRTRQEDESNVVMPNGEKRTHVTIFDPVQQVFISLDPQTKIGTVQRLQPHSPPVSVSVNKPAVAPSVLPRSSSSQQEDLGTMEIEGFQVTGKRFTHTIEAGKIGNDKPIVSMNETWFSDDVKETLLTKSESPQSGQHIRKLVNIHLGDPDPSLFALPPDYRVRHPAISYP